MSRKFKLSISLIILLTGFLTHSNCFSQNQIKIDSLLNVASVSETDTNLVKLYEEVTKLYLNTQFDSARVYAHKMLDISEQLDYKKGIAMGHNWLGESYFRQGIYGPALVHFKKTNKVFAKTGNIKLWAKSFQVIANVYSVIGKSDSAIYLYNQAVKLHEDNNDDLSAAKATMNLAMAYSKRGEFARATKYIYEAQYVFKSYKNDFWFFLSEQTLANIYGRQLMHDSAIVIYKRIINYYEIKVNYHELGESYANIGVLYEGKGELDKALAANRKSMEYRILLDDYRGKAISEMNLASIYFNMEKYDSVINHLNESRKYFEKENVVHPLVYNLLLSGNYYYETEQFQEAINMYLRAYELASDYKMIDYKRDAAEGLSLVHEEMQDYKNALKYAKIYKVQYDSLINEENIKEQTIAVENYKSKLHLFSKEKEIEAEKMQKYSAVIVGVIVAIGLVFLLLYRRKLHGASLMQIEQHNKIEIQNVSLSIQKAERKRVANILHDNLAHVILNSQTQLKKVIADIKPTNQKLLQIDENLEFMNKLAKVASYELEFSLVLENNLVDQFKKYIDRVQHSHSPKISFNHSDRLQFEPLSNEVKINFFSVFQEMLGNAIKYAKAKSIAISLIMDEGKISLQVDDDGIGFDYDNVRHGQGFPNMKERAEKLNGTFSFESEVGFGTKLIFVV